MRKIKIALRFLFLKNICIYCGHNKFKETVKSSIGYTVCEFSIDCQKCGLQHDYFAYGSWMSGADCYSGFWYKIKMAFRILITKAE